MNLWGILKGLLVSNDTDRTKQLSVEISSSATTGTRTTLVAAQTANQTVTLPDSTDTLVGEQTTDALDVRLTDAEADIVQLDSDIQDVASDLASHLSDTVDAHDASAISITPAGGFVATDVQSLAVELDSDITAVSNAVVSAQGEVDAVETALANHLADATDAHDASSIANTPAGNLVATDQQAVNNELQGDIDSIITSLSVKADQSSLNATQAEVDAVEIALANHLADTVDAHDASAVSFVPYLTLGSTDVQAVVQELKDELDSFGGGGANTTLSNLTSPTAINQHLVPDSTNIRNLGAANTIWSNVHSGVIHSHGGGTGIRVFGADFSEKVRITATSTSSPGGTTSTSNIIQNNGPGVITDASLNVFTANGTSAGNSTGPINIETGNNAGAGGSGGIRLYTGTTAGGTRGKILFRDGSEGTAGHVWTSTAADGSGTWAPAASGGVNHISANPNAESDTTGWATYSDFGSNIQNGITVDTVGDYLDFGSVLGLRVGQRVRFFSSVTAPGGLTTATDYFVHSLAGGGATVALSATPGGAQINLTSAGSGTMSLHPYEPGDGTGGTATTTWTRSTSSPLRSTANFLLTKPASLVMGEGVGYAFTTARADRFTVHRIKFNYEVGSGTYADGDVKVFIQDTTNGTIIEPVGYSVLNATLNGVHQATFQTTDSTSYRLIFHVSSTSTSALTMKIDDVEVGPQTIARGPMISDWVSYTPTFTGFGTATAIEGQWRRVGGDAEIRVKWTSGTTTAVEARVSLPSGLTSASTSIIPTIQRCGEMSYSGTGAAQYHILVEPSVAYVTFGVQTAGSGGLAKQNGNLYTSSTSQSIVARVPITGWSSSQVLSSDLSGRLVAAKATITANTSITTSSFVAPNVTYDYTGSYNNTTGLFTCPEPGLYRIKANGIYSAGANYIFGRRNGVNITDNAIVHLQAANVTNGSIEVVCNAGDTLGIASLTNTTLQVSAGLYRTEVIFEKVNNSGQQIAATEAVVGHYGGSTTSIATVTNTPIVMNTKVDDTHGASYNTSTGELTINVAGRWAFIGQVVCTAQASGAITNSLELHLDKNGAIGTELGKALQTAYTTSAVPRNCKLVHQMNLIAGDKVRLIAFHNHTGTASITNNPQYTYFQFWRIG